MPRRPRPLLCAVLQRPRRLPSALLAAAAVWAAVAGGTAGAAERLKTVAVARGLQYPWGLAFLPDGRMLVTERPGRLRIVSARGELSPPVQGLPAVDSGGQGGLLDVALDPHYAENGWIYLSYAEPGDGGNGTAVARAKLQGQRLTDLSVIFRQSPKFKGGNHFGSRLVFGRDGRLFITLGDRFSLRQQAQSAGDTIGKVVRIEPDGRVPADNPLVGKPGARPEIWSWGHRNIQGAALHPQTGELWTHEHGPQGGDEVNLTERGKNYGWPVITYGREYGTGFKIGEGTAKDGMEQPLVHWVPSIAPSGMAFLTSDRYPGWQGSLFVGALRAQVLVRLELDGRKVVREERLLQNLHERIRDVRQGTDGWLYLLTDSEDGKVLRVER
ncbi:PQQ-dependent sugar dehydrogenase [Eleftheria terrae]|uniref:PQQ-dependent sugar dehydrogenase n=1 Tax=Eleftheria terrae TaxID=1597781 RepID=UPI00263B32C0|nr:PQQ-dependent sugar dehydrogenase [Eleftheria terrae]WKB54237.1 PQQ-dependent sugar dehydrogenase [Eleftheria terrae]